MEENLHEDKLGDFVRRSLDDHEEHPPADMWSRVDAALSEEERKPALWFWTSRIPRVAAAILVLALVTTVVAEYWYYEGRLKALQPVTSPAIKMEKPAAPSKTPAEKLPFLVSDKAQNVVDIREKVPVPAPNPFKKAARPRQSLGSDIAPTPAATKGNSAQVVQTVDEHKAASRVAEAVVVEGLQGAQAPVLTETAISKPQLSLENLHSPPTPLPVPPVVVPNKEIAQKAFLLAGAQIKPLKVSQGWYVGIQAGPAFHTGKPKSPIARPGRPAFASQRESGHNRSIGLRVGKRVENGFLLETGITYQNMLRTASHTPRFRFGEGIQIGSPLDRRRLYQYDLETYGGTAEVDLSMERSSSAPQPSDDEPVRLKISMEERLEWLRVPVLAGYHFGHNRWQGAIKTGLMANFMLKDEVKITSTVSQNAIFQPVMQTLHLKPKSLTWGYYLAANAEYRLNRNLSLNMENALMVDFPGKDHYGRNLPKHYLLGLNLGSTYYF